MHAARILFGVFVLASSIVAIADAQVTVYTSPTAFLAATSGDGFVDFTGVVSDSGTNSFGSAGFGDPLNVNFRSPEGTNITFIGPNYCCATYNRGGFASLTGGQHLLNISFPLDPGKAIGFEAFTIAAGNLTGTNQDKIRIDVEGISYYFTTAVAPSAIFIGFTSPTPFQLPITIWPAASASGYRQTHIQNVVFSAVVTATPSPTPFGSVDTPTKNSNNVSGAIGVTGWALSANDVKSVAVWREPVLGETASLIFLGDSSLVPGARPDVAAAYPAYPNNSYGWGLQILTNELPAGPGQSLGNGTYKLHAIATNYSGGATDLSGPIPITVNNASASNPFGTIDTPGQGDIVSGSAYVNFGWALTPNPSNVISKDGSTITVFIDNKPVGHPAYNNNRSDIATLFPGLQNSNGAVGAYTIDTTKLANGIHTISWLASDNAGHAGGLGSRYFFVEN